MSTSLTDKNGQPIALRAGHYIIFEFFHKHYHLLFMENLDGISRIRWPGGDDKNIVDFLKNETDCCIFAKILAQTHGLGILEEKDALAKEMLVFRLV